MLGLKKQQSQRPDVALLTIPPDEAKLVAFLHTTIGTLLGRGYNAVSNVPLRRYASTHAILEYEKNPSPMETNRIFSVASDPEVHRKRHLVTQGLNWLYSFFFLCIPQEKKTITGQMGEDFFATACSFGILASTPDGLFQSLLRFVATDDSIFLTSIFDRTQQLFTYFSYDSLIFSGLIRASLPAGPSRRILDYCCGTGFVGLQQAQEEDTLVGIDISEAAVWFSRLNAALLGQSNTTFIRAKTPPADDRFDLIVCNPPFIFDRDGKTTSLDSSGGGHYGCQKTVEFLELFQDMLTNDGRCFLITRTPVFEDKTIYLYDVLKNKKSRFGGNLSVLSASISPLEEWERELGIIDYYHVLLSFQASAPMIWTLQQPANGYYRFAF
ncbi:methyltransferase [Pseudodesulfovibrio sp.]|uniref:methyltransferase n=1 Tax=unclassified Pseudodesulfovibrio TaxID=2661612 RepID=UPI003AFF6AE5